MFRIIRKNSLVRVGKLTTKSGTIFTPFFMPIATKGAVKHVTSEELLDLGAQIILSNTFHLWLRPGHELIKKAGGLHKFMNWERPILTDSGGFQVFSLSKIRKINDEGVEFASPIDGAKHFLTPEKAIDIQLALGSDIIMVLDECPPYPVSKKQAAAAVERTSKWAVRSRKHFDKKIRGEKKRPLLFGIVQGSIYPDLRAKSLADLKKLNFDGLAIGGLAVGEPEKEMWKMIDFLAPILPEDKPRYLMGLGKPEQLITAINLGIDMFDCVIPTRNARHGTVYVSSARNILGKNGLPKYDTLHIKSAKFRNDFQFVDKNPASPLAKQKITRAYLRHLFQIEEPLAQRLATLQNLWFYLQMMNESQNSKFKSLRP